MIELIFKILGAGLSIWESKEKTKYVDQLIKLKKEYRNEIDKPYDQRDNAALDSIEFQLSILGDSFSTIAGKQGP